MKLIDRAVLVHCLDQHKTNAGVKAFEDYATGVFVTHINKQLEHVKRVDIVIVWDVYKADSLKSSLRAQRGTGTALHITHNTRIPVNWKTFLRVESNKQVLFHFLASSLHACIIPQGKKLVTTFGEHVKCFPDEHLVHLQPCTHEEANSRLMLHAYICCIRLSTKENVVGTVIPSDTSLPMVLHNNLVNNYQKAFCSFMH